MTRFVLHVDLDEFIAAVERLRRPELRGRPIVVGGEGDPTQRGVVSTASYEARAFGIRSGMPLRTAYRRCPEAAFLPVDGPAYLAVSREVMATLRSFPTVVEEAGWDEAFMEVWADDPARIARDVQRAVLERTGLWCTIGVGDNKLRAKIGSAFGKPAGVFRLTRENWEEVVGGLTPDVLWGIGSRTARKLSAMEIRTVEALATADERALTQAFGQSTGPWLRQLAMGEDRSQVSAEPYVPKGRGRERTFQEDLTDPGRVEQELRRLTAELVRELPEGRAAERVVVKVRFAPFITRTHGVRLRSPSSDRRAIEKAALSALERFELDRSVRLVGVRAELTPPA